MTRLFMFVAVCVAAASVAAQQTQPVFRGGVDRVTVDVMAVDAKGRPVRDLTAADFDLQVNGAPRKLLSAEFVAYETPSAEGVRPAAHFSSNETAPSGGRPILIVFDQTSIRAGEARSALASAAKFVDGLLPGTRVGYAAIPPPGPRVEFTADRDAIRKALGQSMGRAQTVPMSFNIGLTEALEIADGNRNTLRVVAGRECPPGDLNCPPVVEQDAITRANTARIDARETLGALRALILALRSFDGPKAIVLLSQGLPRDTNPSGDVSLGVEAAAANTVLYVLQLEPSEVDVSSGRPSPTASLDRIMLQETLDRIAGAGGGASFRVPTSAVFAFDRIASELTGAWLLAFEPLEADRDGKLHRIDVKVKRPGVVVRARREFRVSAETAAAATANDDAAMAGLLRSPTPATGIPLRATTYALKGLSSGKTRVIISAEMGRDVEGAQELSVGYVLHDEKDKVAASSLERAKLTPLRESQPGPLQFVRSAEVPTGRYRLKIAVIDGSGRRGSVEHHVRAEVSSAAPLQMSDLLLVDAAANAARFMPPVELSVDDGRLISVLELYGDRPVLEQASVTFSVGETATSPPLVTAPGTFGVADESRRLAQAGLATGLLPPGRYVARAVITAGGKDLGSASRPFELKPRPVATIDAASGRTGAPAALGSGVPPFRAADALAEPIVTRFTDRLPSGTSPAIREALESARAGRFDAPPVDDNAPDADRLTAVFLRGLTRLSKNQLNDAANDFRAALKISSDFFPALFYLGAAYAAGGKDKDAVGAWQTSLIGEGDAQIIYLAIADAQLRLGDHAGAKAILEEALDSWPDDAPLLTRLARTGVLLGDRRAALDRLDQALSKDPASADALFLGARIVYEAHLGGKPIVSREADIERLKRYASAYAAASGPHRDIVAQWVKYVGGGR